MSQIKREPKKELKDKIVEYLRHPDSHPDGIHLDMLQKMAKSDGLNLREFDEALSWAAWEGELVVQTRNRFKLKR